MKFPWTALLERMTEQQNAIEVLRKRCRALEEDAKKQADAAEKNFKELRAACIEPSRYMPSMLRMLWSDDYATKPYTAMDAVNLLLKHNGLEITAEPAKDAKHKLVPIKTAKKK
jgi:hypothetical protein